MSEHIIKPSSKLSDVDSKDVDSLMEIVSQLSLNKKKSIHEN